MTGIPADAVAERTAKRAEMGFQPPLPEETPPAEGNGFTPPLPDASGRAVVAPLSFPPRPQFPVPPSVLGLPPFQPPPGMPGAPPPIGGFPSLPFALPRGQPRFPGIPGLPQPPFPPMPGQPPGIQTPPLHLPAGGSPATSGSVLPQPPPVLPDHPPAVPHVNLEVPPPLPPDTSAPTAVGMAAAAPPPQPAPPEAPKYELSMVSKPLPAQKGVYAALHYYLTHHNHLFQEEQRAALPRYAILSR